MSTRFLNSEKYWVLVSYKTVSYLKNMYAAGIAVAGEETTDPSSSIPIATIASMSVVAVLYALAAVVLSLLLPWFEVYIPAPFPDAFEAQVCIYLYVYGKLENLLPGWGRVFF